MKKLLLLFLLLPTLLLAQDNYIDSLKNEVVKATDDTIKIALLIDIIDELDEEKRIKYVYQVQDICLKNLAKLTKKDDLYIYYKTTYAATISRIGSYHSFIGKPDSALYFYKESLKINEEIGDTKGIAELLNNIAYHYESIDNMTTALEYYQKCLKVCETNEKLVEVKAAAISSIGLIFNKKGDIKTALEYLNQSLKIYEQIKKESMVAMLINNIGTIHDNQGEVEKALEYYTRNLNYLEKTGNKYGLAVTLNNIGLIHNNKAGEIRKNNPTVADSLSEVAGKLFFKAYDLYSELKSKKGIAGAYTNIGYYYLKKAYDNPNKQENEANYIKALDNFEKSLAIRIELKDRDNEAASYYNIAGVYIRSGNLAKALPIAVKGLNLAKELGYPKLIMRSANQLKEIYNKQNNYAKSYEMLELSIAMRDSISNQETRKASIRSQLTYEYEKKSLADSIRTTEEKKLIQVKLEQQKTQKYALYLGLFLVLLFTGFIYNRFKITQKQKQVIEIQKSEVEQQKHLVEEKNSEILQSINYAKRLQQSILPPPRVVKEYIAESFILYLPKDIVAGDFYWMESVNGKIYFAAADCTGHGVPGAMIAMVCYNALNRALLEFQLRDPAKILDKVNEFVEESFSKGENEVKDGMDISLCCLDKNTLELQWAGANNPLWIIPQPPTSPLDNLSLPVGSLGEVIEYKPDKQPVGKFDNRFPFTNHIIQLHQGDSIYLFTDGLADQFGGIDGKKYTYKRFKNKLLEINEKPMAIQKDIIYQEFENWKKSEEQVDDICVIGVRV